MVKDVGHAGSRDGAPLDPRTTLDEATLPVRTEVLERHGIESLRVVSASRFLEIVERLAAATRSPVEPCAGAGSEDASSAPPEARAVQEAWTRLRASCLDRLRRVEEMGATVGGTLSELEAQLDRIAEQDGDARSASTPAPDSVESRRLALLRGMFAKDLSPAT